MNGNAEMTGKIIRIKYITRDMVRAHRETIFVFGDNCQRQGLGGQAGAMRGEINTVGIPTKWEPNNLEKSYFRNYEKNSWEDLYIRAIIYGEFQKLYNFLLSGINVVIPLDGLGTGLSKLPEKAPLWHQSISKEINYLEKTYGTLDTLGD